jgi:hypothetical protein
MVYSKSQVISNYPRIYTQTNRIQNGKAINFVLSLLENELDDLGKFPSSLLVTRIL